MPKLALHLVGANPGVHDQQGSSMPQIVQRMGNQAPLVLASPETPDKCHCQIIPTDTPMTQTYKLILTHVSSNIQNP